MVQAHIGTRILLHIIPCTPPLHHPPPFHSGCVLVGVLGRNAYLNGFPTAIRQLSTPINNTALRELFTSMDAIGISAYPSLEPGFDVCEIEEVLMGRLDTGVWVFEGMRG